MVEVKIGYWTDGPNWILIWSGNRNEMQYCSRKQNHNASRVKRSMHFTSFDIITLYRIHIYLSPSPTRSMLLYHHSNDETVLKQELSSHLLLDRHDWESPCAWRKIHTNYMMMVHWNVGITVKIFLIYISNVVLSHILITLAGCGSPVDTPALQRAICISFIYLQVASTVYLITNVFFLIFILFTVMLKLISKRANFALIPGNVKETWRQ